MVDSLIRKGEIHTFENGDTLYMYYRKKNEIYSIGYETYNYINQRDSFVFDKKIEEQIAENIIEKKESTPPNIYINISVKKLDTSALIVKKVLENYNKCNVLYLIINVDYKSLDLINEILKWVNGFERLIIVCQIPVEKDFLYDELKKQIINLREKYTVKFILEYYETVYTLNDRNRKHKIKISPLLSSKKMNLNEKNKYLLILKSNKISHQFAKSLQSNLRLRSSVIQSITDNEFIDTKNYIDNNCNTCWAKRVCHSNHYYKIFSSHPYICAINNQNCLLIKNGIESVIKNIVDEDTEKKLGNKEFKFKNYTVHFLNP